MHTFSLVFTDYYLPVCQSHGEMDCNRWCDINNRSICTVLICYLRNVNGECNEIDGDQYLPACQSHCECNKMNRLK